MTAFEQLPPERHRLDLPSGEAPLYRAPAPVDEPTSSFSPRELVAALRRHLWLILGTTAVSTTMAVLRVKTEDTNYTSSAVIRLKDTRRALTGGLGGAPNEELAGRLVDPVQSQIELLTSRSVAAQVVDSLHELRVQPKQFPDTVLGRIYTGGTEGGDSVALQFGPAEFEAHGRTAMGRAVYGEMVELDSFRFTVKYRPSVAGGYLRLVPRDAAVNRLISRIKVKPRPNTDVIDVSYTDLEKARAQKAAAILVDVFQGVSTQTSNQQSVRRRKFLETQLAHSDSVLNEARARLSAFRGRQRAYSTREKLTTEQAGLSGLEVRREELDADRRLFQDLLSQLEGNRVDRQQLGAIMSAPGLASNPVIGDLYKQLNLYQASRDSLTVGAFGATAANPDVQRLDHLIASTEAKLVTALRSVVASLNARIQSLDGMRTRNATDFPALSATEEEEARLTEEEQTARERVAQLRTEYEKARLDEAVEAGQIELVDPASTALPVIKVGPVRKIGFGFMLGLLLGSTLAYLLERMNTSIRRRDQIRSVLRLPELAVIPQVSRTTALRVRAGGSPAVRNGMRLPGRTTVGSRGDALIAHDTRSVGAEAYRLLRTNLLFSIPTGSPRTVVVTSPAPGDGKTTVAANLAATFARQGMRVLLIDCDLRRGRLHSLFRFSREPGLTQVLAGQAVLTQVVHQTPLDGLSVLTTGSVPGNPGELVGGEPMRALLEQASQEFNLVVLDTPPVLAAADAAVLSSVVDATILVVRAGRTREMEAQTTIEHLTAVNARVVGAVLNDQDSKLQQYGQYYYYSGYYGPDA